MGKVIVLCCTLGLPAPQSSLLLLALPDMKRRGGVPLGGFIRCRSGGQRRGVALRCLRVVLIKTEIDAFQAFTGCAPACLHNRAAAAAAVSTGRRILLRSLLPPRPPLPPYQPHRASCGPRLRQTERLPAYSDRADNRGGENETWQAGGFPPPPPQPQPSPPPQPPPSPPPQPQPPLYQIRLRHQYLASLARPHLHSVVGGEHLRGPQRKTFSSGMCVLLRMYVVCRCCAFCCVFCCMFCILEREKLPVTEPSAADGHALQKACSLRSERGNGGGSEGRGW